MSKNISKINNINLNSNSNICGIKSECSNKSHSIGHTKLNNGEYICKNCSSIVCKGCILKNNVKCAICLYHPKKNYCELCREDVIILLCHECGKKISFSKAYCPNNIPYKNIWNFINCLGCYERKK